MKVYTCGDFLKTGPTEPAERVDGLLPVAGVPLLVGPSLGGKTRLMVGAIAAVDHARDAQDPSSCSFAGRRLRVDDIGEREAVIVAGEHSEASWRALIRAAARSYGRETLAVRIVRPAPTIDLTNDSDFDALAALMEIDPWLVVLDSLRALHLGDENASADIRDIMRRCSQLTGDRRLVTPVHHLGQNGSIRGSSDLQAAADSVIEVIPRQAGHLTLKVRSHDAAESRLELRMLDDGLRFEPVEAEAPVHDDDEQRRRDSILEALDGGARLSNGKLYRAAREAAKRADRGPLGQDRQILATAKAMAAEGLIAEEGQDVDHIWRRVSSP